MTDIESLVGKDNMTLTRKEAVIAIIKNLNAPATTKRFLYARWARLIGSQAIKDDIDRVAPWSQGA